MYRTVALLFLIVSSAAVGQEASRNLYADALEASIVTMERQWGHIDDSASGVRTNYRHMFVESNPVLTEDLPHSFGDHEVEYLDFDAAGRKFKQYGKPFPVLNISPMKTQGDELQITVTVYWTSVKGRRMMKALSDWAVVSFHHDCTTHQFVVSDVKLGGI